MAWERLGGSAIILAQAGIQFVAKCEASDLVVASCLRAARYGTCLAKSIESAPLIRTLIAAVPRAIIKRLIAETVKPPRDPLVVQHLSSQGAEPANNTPEEFTVFVRAKIDKWTNLVKAANMKAV